MDQNKQNQKESTDKETNWDEVIDKILEDYEAQLNSGGNNMIFESTDKESTDFERPHVEEGLHPAEFLEAKEISEGTYGPRAVLLFRLIEQDVELGQIVYTTNKASPNNKIGRTLTALGANLGKEIDTETLKGTKCRVLVEDYTYEKDGKETTASSISKVKPLAEKA